MSEEVQEQRPNPPKYEKFCRSCHKRFVPPFPNSKICPECRLLSSPEVQAQKAEDKRQRHAEAQKRYREKQEIGAEEYGDFLRQAAAYARGTADTFFGKSRGADADSELFWIFEDIEQFEEKVGIGLDVLGATKKSQYLGECRAYARKMGAMPWAQEGAA